MRLTSLLTRGFFALLLLGSTARARAFDTGHHFDLTQAVLAEARMGEQAINVCQVENWLVDYYANSTTSSALGTPARMKHDLALLHFDNLFTSAQVAHYWDRLTANSRSAFTQAAKEGDAMKVLSLLGMSLHAVQDFYTHSNWVETHPALGADYNTVTWFDSPRREGLHTGRYDRPGTQALHGDYTSGMNHDSHGRPGWDAAYVFAYAASRQWVSNAERWVRAVDPAVWQKAKALTLSARDEKTLDRDTDAMLRVSEWVCVKADGHWKGSGSGSQDGFTRILSAWLREDSAFTAHFTEKGWYRLLAGSEKGQQSLEVDAPSAVPVPSLTHVPIRKKAVLVRTLAVEEEPVGLLERKIDSLGKPDFYALMLVDGQIFMEAAQIDKSAIRPTWTTIKFVDAGTARVTIRYQLWDQESGIVGARDEACDINPGPGTDLDVTYTLDSHALTGSLNGVFDSPARAWSGKGNEKNRAAIRLYITTRGLTDP